VEGGVAPAKTFSGSTLLAPVSPSLINTVQEPKALLLQAPVNTMQTINTGVVAQQPAATAPTVLQPATTILKAPTLLLAPR
jgi:hypothetical protein